MNIEEKYHMYETQLAFLKERRGMLGQVLFDSGNTMSSLRANLPQLLYEYYIHDDPAAKVEFDRTSAKLAELKEVVHYRVVLSNMLDQEETSIRATMQSLKPQLDHYQERQTYWRREYDIQLSKLHKAQFETFNTIKDRILDITSHINDEDLLAECKEMISDKQTELGL